MKYLQVAYLAILLAVVHGQISDDDIREWVDIYNNGDEAEGIEGAVNLCNKQSLANWNVQTNVGVDQYVTEQSEASLTYSRFRMQYFNAYWSNIVLDTIEDPLLRRQISALKNLGVAAASEEDQLNLSSAVNRMSRVYNEAVICPLGNNECNAADALTLDPHITLLMASSNNYEELEHIWTEWHDKSGRLMREDYGEYVEMMNTVAVANQFSNAAEWWQSSYEGLNMDSAIDPLWSQVQPLYKSLHTYVRHKLRRIYGSELNQFGDNMPAHLLGNMWAQSWTNLYDRIKPFETDSLGTVTENMVKQNYTVQRMFEVADDFFQSMNLGENSMSYDPTRAVVENPTDRTIACHASAWDFCKDNDFRIKMCTKITYEDFITVHHEMGHIQYYIQYAHQDLQLRGGANPAFHEAIGDTIALSFATPKHLHSIGLLDELEDSLEGDINALFLMALERVAFLPFGLLIDKWRWEVFSGAVTEENWNARWWELRQEYQGIVPPTERSEEFFDPGAKYHVPANSQYIGYFFAHILEFQFYRSLCIAAGEFNPNDPSSPPLHKCDFYGSIEAGNLMKSGLEIGTSQTWQSVLEVMTGANDFDGSALIDYFKPLQEYLDQENERFVQMEEVRVTLETYDAMSAEIFRAQVHADWAVTTDLESEEKQADLTVVNADTARFVKQQYELHFAGLNNAEFDDVSISRQLRYLSNLGTAILSDSDLIILNDAQRHMQDFYNRAKVCPFQTPDCNEETEGLALNPGIETVMAQSTDFDELRHVWTKWHDNSGGQMRADYKVWMDMSNQAAIDNNFSDLGDMWRFDYEYENLEESMLKLWDEVKPLYDVLHTYVRHQLIDLYGVDKIDVNDELIPAHLLGNMWAQSWVNLYERIKPFKQASDIDVTASMVAQGYTPLRMFQLSDKFYMDLGLSSSEMSYTGPSIIEQPQDRLIVCHASAWDFLDGADFRVKQCTLVNMEHLVTVHHEMGHIQYFIEYANQPIVFRHGANPGFHEAVGDLIALSVTTPKHLEKIGLLENYQDSPEDNINALLKMALERVAFLPFGLLIDLYRWDQFSGKIQENQWNSHWEELRQTYQKIRSPVQRNESHFDAAAKFHVAGGSQYINYFIAHILQFQLHKTFCEVAGEYDPADPLKPLHKCDIDESLEVGSRLRAGLSIGLSQHWSETLFLMTGERDLSASAILEYFAPLMQFMEAENARWSPPGELMPLVPIIVGAVIGGALLIGLIVAISFYFIKKRRGIPHVELKT